MNPKSGLYGRVSVGTRGNEDDWHGLKFTFPTAEIPHAKIVLIGTWVVIPNVRSTSHIEKNKTRDGSESISKDEFSINRGSNSTNPVRTISRKMVH